MMSCGLAWRLWRMLFVDNYQILPSNKLKDQPSCLVNRDYSHRAACPLCAGKLSQ
jgi:hypothetical protein